MARILGPLDYTRMPWRNGGGVTTEIALGPDPAGILPWLWRVSIAEVTTSGPFSRFPGVDRQIAVIAGAGMDLLRRDGSRLALDPHQVVAFAGEEALDGVLRAGPVRDINVMTVRGRVRAALTLVRGDTGAGIAAAPGQTVLVHALTGAWRVAGGIDLPAGATAVFPPESAVDAAAGAQDMAAVVALTHRASGAPPTTRACSGRAPIR